MIDLDEDDEEETKPTRVLIISPEGTSELWIDLWELPLLQGVVGVYLECVSLCDEAHAFIHEEGKILNLPRNDVATRLCGELQTGLMLGDYINGKMIVVGSLDEDGEDDGNIHDCPQDVIELVARLSGVDSSEFSREKTTPF